MVAQLHVHIVARFVGDDAWPGPVWGSGQSLPYEDEAAARLLADLRRALEGLN
jgi:diadenosine tetraphosphate (Ap4A) HIT family hydrolase